MPDLSAIIHWAEAHRGQVADDDMAALLALALAGESASDVAPLLDEDLLQEGVAAQGAVSGGHLEPVVRVSQLTCADCPTALNGQAAFVSPESGRKFSYVLGYHAMEGVPRVVCRSCYRAAFARVYPGQRLPV